MQATQTETGWACRQCNRNAKVSSFLAIGVDQERATNYAKAAAERCCICDNCGDSANQTQYCNGCNKVYALSSLISQITTCYLFGIRDESTWNLLENELDYGYYMHRLECIRRLHEHWRQPGMTSTCTLCKEQLAHSFDMVTRPEGTFHRTCTPLLTHEAEFAGMLDRYLNSNSDSEALYKARLGAIGDSLGAAYFTVVRWSQGKTIPGLEMQKRTLDELEKLMTIDESAL